jgi:hypothetical protein
VRLWGLRKELIKKAFGKTVWVLHPVSVAFIVYGIVW